MNLVVSSKLYEKDYVMDGLEGAFNWYKVRREDNVIVITGEHEGLGMLGGQ